MGRERDVCAHDRAARPTMADLTHRVRARVSAELEEDGSALAREDALVGPRVLDVDIV